MLAMLEMVTMKSKGQKTLSPIHLISLVDPKAKWLKAWIHGNLGRQLFFNLAASTHDNLFFKTAMHHLLVTMERDTFPLLSRTSGRKKGLISSSLVSFAFFSHNLHVTCMVLQYYHGQKMFPLALPNRDELNDGRSLIKAMVTFVANARIASHQTPAKLITTALISGMSNDKNIQKFWNNDEIINLIIVPLLNWPQLQHSARALNLCQILAAWLKTPSGKSFALGVKTETGLTLPDFLLDFTSNFLKSLTSLSHQNEQVLVAALKLCQHIGKSYSCVLTNKFGNFVKNLNDGLADIEELYLMTPTNSMANINFESHASELKGCVFYVLKCIASTPLGLYCILQQEGLYPALIQDFDFQSEEMSSTVTYETLQSLDDLTQFLFSKEFTLQASFITYAKLSVIISDREMFAANKSKLEQVLPLDDNFVYDPGFENAPLKTLMVLLNNLDVRLVLLTHYDIESNMEKLLEDCKHEDGSIIFDEQSLILQYILESLKCVGGPTERKIVKLDYEKAVLGSSKKEDEISFDEGKSHEPNEFLALLKEDPRQNKDWKTRATVLFEKYTKGNGNLSWQILAETLFKLHNNPNFDVNKQSEIDLVTENQMESVAKMFKVLATKQGLDIPNRIFIQILNGNESERWLLMVLTLLFKGNFPKALAMSKRIAKKHNFMKIGHCVELILKEEFPMILAKLKSMSISPAFVSSQWLKQYFLNTLDFMQIINFLLIESLYPKEYAIYTCISIFKHLEQKILLCTGEEELILVLLCDPILNFRFGDCLEYMHNLGHKYDQHLRQ